MSKEIGNGKFALSDLVKVDDSNWVILGSGSPIMEVVTTEGDMCLCEWESDDGTKQRHLFPFWVLRRMIRFRPEDLPFANDDPLDKGIKPDEQKGR